MRYFVIGNGGSGKSYMSRKLSEITGYRVIHLDHLFFKDKHYQGCKPDKERLCIMKEIVKEDNIIIEEYIDYLFYLNVDWEEAEKGLMNRKYDPIMTTKKAHKDGLDRFIEYCRTYYVKEDDEICKDSHDKLYNEFKRKKKMFNNRLSVNNFLKEFSIK